MDCSLWSPAKLCKFSGVFHRSSNTSFSFICTLGGETKRINPRPQPFNRCPHWTLFIKAAGGVKQPGSQLAVVVEVADAEGGSSVSPLKPDSARSGFVNTTEVDTSQRSFKV